MTKKPMKKNNIRFAFFGTSHIAVCVLDALEKAALMPALVVTVPQKPKGRGLEAKPGAVEVWADERGIPVAHEWSEFESKKWDAAVIVDYGRILPRTVLDIPTRGFLNVHPSLLPRLRGASPMRSAILNDERAVGVSIMHVDEEMDHGPLVAQRRIEISDWPPRNSELERILMEAGGALLAQILPLWIEDEVEARPQNHDLATYSQKFTKEDGLLDLSADAYQNLLKIRALENWPGTYAFFERNGKKIRVAILSAHLENTKLVIDTVKPEGKKEMKYEEFLRSGARPATAPRSGGAPQATAED